MWFIRTNICFMGLHQSTAGLAQYKTINEKDYVTRNESMKARVFFKKYIFEIEFLFEWLETK